MSAPSAHRLSTASMPKTTVQEFDLISQRAARKTTTRRASAARGRRRAPTIFASLQRELVMGGPPIRRLAYYMQFNTRCAPREAAQTGAWAHLEARDGGATTKPLQSPIGVTSLLPCAVAMSRGPVGAHPRSNHEPNSPCIAVGADVLPSCAPNTLETKLLPFPHLQPRCGACGTF